MFGDLPAKLIQRWIDQELSSGVVLGGPFQGMRLGERTSSKGLIQASAYYPKLLGTYEQELAPLIRTICALELDCIIDVGAAEGYYAVGFALAAKAPVIAFEAHGPEALLELAASNGVANKVTGHGLCDATALRQAFDGTTRACLMMDIEGGECVLLDPLVVPALSRAWIIVEVHDCFLPGTTALLKRRFADSHFIEDVVSTLRQPKDFPLAYSTKWFDPSMYYLEFMGERPTTMNWLYMTPKVFSDKTPSEAL